MHVRDLCLIGGVATSLQGLDYAHVWLLPEHSQDGVISVSSDEPAAQKSGVVSVSSDEAEDASA